MMKNTIVIICVTAMIIGCKNKKGLDLEIINTAITSLKSNTKDLNFNMRDSVILNKSKTILIYKLTNNENKTYYFNVNYFDSKLANRIGGLSIYKSFINIYDKKGINIKYKYAHPMMDFDSIDFTKERNNKISKFLNYKIDGQQKFMMDNNNFIIHPSETIYFEWFLNLPYGNSIQNATIELDYTKEYYAEMTMFSDSTNYKKILSRTVLQTIKENGYEVYHGIIKSKNKVPIKFIK